MIKTFYSYSLWFVRHNMNDVVHKILDLTIGNLLGKDITCREPVDECDEYQPGTVVEFGRTGLKVFLRKIFSEKIASVLTLWHWKTALRARKQDIHIDICDVSLRVQKKFLFSVRLHPYNCFEAFNQRCPI